MLQARVLGEQRKQLHIISFLSFVAARFAVKRADLVSTHATAVAFDLCCEDFDEASADYNRV